MTGQATAKLRKLRMSPRKVRLLVDLIRGLSVSEALIQLQFNSKHAARPVYKLLQSAVANAVNNHHLTESSLRISEAFVDGGQTLHRWVPRAFGRATPIRKRASHITLVLKGEVDTAAAKKVAEAKMEAVIEAPKADETPKKRVTRKKKEENA